MRSLCTFLLLTLPVFGQAPVLQTAAERTQYAETTKHADVIAFGTELAKLSPKVKATTYGTSREGRPLPLLILSSDGITSPDALRLSRRPVLFAFANIHAGEVDGKEALLALGRDLALKNSELLKTAVILLAPNINPDGNEKLGPDNRPGQNGPHLTGTRENADGFDLNRDWVKLESPEIRAIVRLVQQWDPLVIIDCHTTNGSKHRFTLTYESNDYPAGDAKLNTFGKETLLRDAGERLKKATGFDSFFYGNFNRDRTQWTTYPATPRFSTQYLGMRNRLGILSESYSYASFADRVKASYHFVNNIFESSLANRETINKLVTGISSPTKITLKTQMKPAEKPVTILAFDTDGKPKDYTVQHLAKLVPTLEVEVPFAYLIPQAYAEAARNLQRHGVMVEELREDIELDCEQYTVTKLQRAERAFQKHNTVTLTTEMGPRKTTGRAGDWLVRTSQSLGRLAAYLLEPQAEDGLTTWNFFDAGLKEGQPFPVLRISKQTGIATGSPRPLPELQSKNKPIDAAFLMSGRGFGGGEVGGVTWLPDGEHFLQSKGGTLLKVHARTGRGEPFVDAEKLAQSMATLDAAPRGPRGPQRRGGGGGVSNFRMNPARTGTLVDLPKGVIGFAYFDGRPGVKLTKAEARNEFVTFSPTGTHIAFVRGGNLFTVDLATQTEKQLTTDGGTNDILNARGDWVYEEEIFNRNGRAYWWNDTGTAIAFLRFDDKPVKRFTLAEMYPAAGGAEVYAYPKPGDPNPLVQIGVANLTSGQVTFLDLSAYKPEDRLVSRVGFLPKSESVFAFVQNRVQTWLDFVVWDTPSAKAKVLFRDKTPAWIEDAGEPKFLPDGSFLYLSERSGWKHIYHYAADGKLLRPVTTGEWEVREIHRIDETSLLVSGTKDGSTGSNLYRVPLTGGGVTRITVGDGTHTVAVAPVGELYTDRFTDSNTPSRAKLKSLSGPSVRTLDSNPMYERDEYRFGKYERLQVPMPDGFLLEAAIVYPPDFDASKKYPIWISTYAGPHAPTVREAWGWRGFEQALASMGVISFRVDPRPASGKGAASAWTCFRQLGVQELKDLESAVDWLAKKPWADAKRVGISGHSYGGFITAYALTHSTKFAAGIAGAPPTDWRLYDTIYTERYMGVPSDNKDGYDKTSVVKAAANLNGKLLLIHGLMDDNVHIQNTMQLADALQKANKPFEMMVYPPSRHGIGGAHYTNLQIDFIRRTMLVR